MARWSPLFLQGSKPGSQRLRRRTIDQQVELGLPLSEFLVQWHSLRPMHVVSCRQVAVKRACDQLGMSCSLRGNDDSIVLIETHLLPFG